MEEAKRIIIPTADGSKTISVAGTDITYHSTHGALQESLHIYLKDGLDAALAQFQETDLQLFEMGFGTGLNAFLTALKAVKEQRHISYTCVETVPVGADEAEQLNYAVSPAEKALFLQLHQAAWGQKVPVNDYFTLEKRVKSLQECADRQMFHLIYYDAFSPGHQPELWTQAVFEQCYAALKPNGILVTYCSKSVVRKAMQAAGFLVSKLPGPRGKREILRAVKP